MFSTGPGTPLFSSTWVPLSVDAYAGTCIFLIVLAAIFRFLIAFKSMLEKRWIDVEVNRRYVAVTRKPNTKERISSNAESSRALLTENGVEEDVIVVRRHMKGVRPWRITTDGPRAAIDTVIAGVLFLLMLAIMTMNVGYLLSVLCGTFLGSLAVGRYGGGGEAVLHV